jgi:uncharacterized protein
MARPPSNFSIKINDILSNPDEPNKVEDLSVKKYEIDESGVYRLISPVKIQADLDLIDKDQVSGKFSIGSNIGSTCTRCLDDAVQNLEITTYARFAKSPNSDDEVYPITAHGVIDIEDLIYQEIVSHIPDRFLCKEDCKGLCTECGKNLNHGTCKHIKE